MKRFAVTLAVVGMVMLFVTFAVGFYAWAPMLPGRIQRLRQQFIEQRILSSQFFQQWLLAGKLFQQRHDLCLLHTGLHLYAGFQQQQ